MFPSVQDICCASNYDWNKLSTNISNKSSNHLWSFYDWKGDLLIYALKPQIRITWRCNEQAAVAPSVATTSFPQQVMTLTHRCYISPFSYSLKINSTVLLTVLWVYFLVVCRCVSGKRLCSGCSQPLEKGAAMIIDTLGLFFHMQCFKVSGLFWWT